MSLRSVKTPQQQGRDYEAELAARYGGKAQPASGATPRWRLDLKLGSLLFSVKHTTHESYRLTAAELREALEGAQGPAGRGEVPAMMIKMEGFSDDVWILRGSDMHALFEGDVEFSIAPTKRSAKLAAASHDLPRRTEG
jgi:hypothetical protein